VNAIAQLLGSNQLGTVTGPIAAQVRFNLTRAIGAAASLQSLSAQNTASLVQSLRQVASDPSQLDTTTLDLILSLTSELASLSGSSADDFVVIIASLNTYLASTSMDPSHTDTIETNIRLLMTSMMTYSLCDQQAQTASTAGLTLTGQISSSLASSSLGSNVRFGQGFPALSSACTEVHTITSELNMYSFAELNSTDSFPAAINASSLASVSAASVTINFYNPADTAQEQAVAGLSSDGSITLSIPSTVDARNGNNKNNYYLLIVV